MLLIGAQRLVAGGTHGCSMSSAIYVGSALSADPKNNEKIELLIKKSVHISFFFILLFYSYHLHYIIHIPIYVHVC
jgi:hypothetical protein